MKLGKHDGVSGPLLVAEIGNNHEGSAEVAHLLIRAAAECGVHAVKFQTFKTEDYVSADDVDRFNRLKSFELSVEEFTALSEYAHDLGLAFMSTPFDLGSVETLTPIVDAFKIASGDNDFVPLLRSVCDTDKPLVVSTGLTDLRGSQQIVDLIHGEWELRNHPGELALLHCVSTYPTPGEYANIRAITTLKSIPRCEIGYSDHTIGMTACLAAVALGARIIEKHFTLDKEYSSFRDHQFSADPSEMRALVVAIRELEEILGDGNKRVVPCEKESELATRRSIAAAKHLPKGHRLVLDDLTWIRPRRGLAPGQEDYLVGHRTVRAVVKGEAFSEEMIERTSL